MSAHCSGNPLDAMVLWKKIPGSSLCLVRLAGCPTVSPRGLLSFNGTDLHRMVNRSMMPNTVFTCTTTSVFYSRPLHFFDTTHGGTVQLNVSRLCSIIQRLTSPYNVLQHSSRLCVRIYGPVHSSGSNGRGLINSPVGKKIKDILNIELVSDEGV